MGVSDGGREGLCARERRVRRRRPPDVDRVGTCATSRIEGSSPQGQWGVTARSAPERSEDPVHGTQGPRDPGFPKA